MKSDNIETVAEDDIAQVIYMRGNDKDKSSSQSPLQDHLVLAENVSLGSNTLRDLSTNSNWTEANLKYKDKIDVENCVRYTYDHSPVKVILIRLKTGDERLVVKSLLLYNLEKEYFVTEFDQFNQQGTTGFENRSLKGELYFSFYLDENYGIRNSKFGVEFPADMFQSSVKTVANSPFSIQLDASTTCPELYPNNFSRCFQCAVNECSNDGLCAIACGFQPAACAIGFTLACTVPIR